MHPAVPTSVSVCGTWSLNRVAAAGMQAFDDLLLLKRGGLVIYMGSLGERSVDLVNYFQGIKGVPAIKEGLNPATWMLEVSTLTQEERIGVDFAECYRDSELFR